MTLSKSLKKAIEQEHNKRKKGLYQKFIVRRTDKRDRKGQKHHNCRYFVLDLDHDPYAKVAVKSYALACAHEYPNLAEDLLNWATGGDHALSKIGD